MTKLRVAVIGAGTISDIHLRAYADHPDVEVYSIVDLNETRARLSAAKFGAAKTFSNYREMLADPAVDAVSICTWNNTHGDLSIAALDAGKHVLCEKPLCTTVEKALEVEAAVRRSGKLLQVGYVRRYASNAAVLRRFIEAGDLGEIYYAKATCLRRLGNPGGWFADKERAGGGPLFDVGVHVIDLCWYMMGRPKVKSVSGNTYHKLGNRANIQNLGSYKAADFDTSTNTVEDMANALIRFENGASMMVDVSFTLHAAKNELSVKLYGDKGGAELEPELLIVGEKQGTIVNMTPQINYPAFTATEGFHNEIGWFVDCCLDRQELISPVEDGVELTKILCAIYESSERGAEIHL